MAGPPDAEQKRIEAIAETRKEMEFAAVRLRDLIGSQPPEELLGYIYGQRAMSALQEPGDDEAAERANIREMTNELQFVLEYVHAVLAATPEKAEAQFDEAVCAEIFSLCDQLRNVAVIHAMASSVGVVDGAFGPGTADIDFQAKSTWLLLRGNRYQVLEGEFFAYVLAPHDDFLREVYGISAADIAAGFQDVAHAVRSGHAHAAESVTERVQAAQEFAESRGVPFQDALADWFTTNAAELEQVALAFKDMIAGGICNISRHSRLTPNVLADLSYERGEEKEFFAEGEYSGTPFRTLPARKKPLIKIGDEYFATDPCFIRDAGYRALLWNLLRRRPEYKDKFNERQKVMSESAFYRILSDQMKEASVFQEVYYKDPKTRQWVENDTLIVVDDVLFLIEAKSGAAATIASPVLDFPRHVQAVQDLVVKAYKQCKRFFEYLASENEVSIFKRTHDRYVECAKLRRENYRVLLPIGLTVESFSPFSTMCKELPEINPISGRHPFISISIDELFVLKRFLPTMGELSHYFEVRQIVAGMRGAHLFDELDHLGAYIRKNRFDITLSEALSSDKPDMLVLDGMSDIVDRYFEGPDWEDKEVPSQPYPDEIKNLLSALDMSHSPAWLSAESHIRNYDDETRANLSKALWSIRSTLDEHQSRNFSLLGSPPLFVWMQREESSPDFLQVAWKAAAVAIAGKSVSVMALYVVATPRGYASAQRLHVDVPSTRTSENAWIFEEAERMLKRQVKLS